MMLSKTFVLVLTSTITFAIGEDLVVKIKNGMIKGSFEETFIEHTQYYAFRGIPYAEPPLSELRFLPPIEPKNWDGILDASSDKAVCVQLYRGSYTVTEDCLYINVYTPSLNQSKLPVMVFIYGGAFILGDSSYSSYGPDYFLDKDVVFVSFNYRMGMFGFYSTEDDVAPGNAGLKDQLLALKWVKENIAIFGGDPENITAFGESAGAASISYLMQSPSSKGLFHRAILESGTALNLWALARNKRDSTFKTGLLLGINTTDSKVLLKEMQKIDSKEVMYSSLVTEASIMAIQNPLDGLLFSPSLEPDNSLAIITSKSHENFKNGDFHKIPTIMGYNSLEAGYFYLAMPLIRLYLVSYALNNSRLSPVDMNIKNETNFNKIGQLIEQHYNMENIILAPDETILKFISDDQFVRPTNELAKLQSNFAPVYLYRFSYRDNASAHNNVSGIGHTLELELLFRRGNTVLVTERDIKEKERMVRMWTNFAKTSNPTPTEDIVLQNITWQAVSPQTQHFLDIGDDLVVGVDPSKEDIAFWDLLYEQFGNPPYDTY